MSRVARWIGWKNGDLFTGEKRKTNAEAQSLQRRAEKRKTEAEMQR
jgi:hypothetical protein